MCYPYRTTLKHTTNRYGAKAAGEINLFHVVQYLLDIIDHSGVTTPRYENEFQYNKKSCGYYFFIFRIVYPRSTEGDMYATFFLDNFCIDGSEYNELDGSCD